MEIFNILKNDLNTHYNKCGFCLKPVKVCCSFIFESLTQNINMLLISTHIFDSVFTKERNTTNVYYTFIS